jgi:hypothetical protein
MTMPTVSQENNAAFRGEWTTETDRRPEGDRTLLFHNGKEVAAFKSDTDPQIITQVFAFVQCATNLYIGNLSPQIPRIFITANQEEINRRGGHGETFATVEVERAKDNKQARFSLSVAAPDKGGVFGSFRSQRPGEVDTVKETKGYFVDYDKKD